MTSCSIPDQPSAWVVRFAPLIPAGEVLDLACGRGRHARFLAAQGHSVLAVDRDGEALAAIDGDRIRTQQLDLEGGTAHGADWPLQAGRFAGIVVTNYLHRPLLENLLASLAPGGVLLYETFAQGNERYGRPANPDFLLAPEELLDIARVARPTPLLVLAFEAGRVELPKRAVIQRICAMRPDPAKVADLPLL
jgi:SAM-dependent methyltransferase